MPGLGRVRREEHEFKASLGYTVRPWFQRKECVNKKNGLGK
jgi:hypothetical protein